jgi:D-amino-acid dehydrogenase
MKICVLGAGVIGLTTAWWLAEAGHDVTIIDRHAAGGAEASAANGGQLSYTFVAPLASPATLLKLPSLLMFRDGPVRIRAGFDPALIHWGARFLLACRSGAARATISAQLRLAASSRVELEHLTQAMGLAFGLKTAGKLVVYRTETEFNSARRAVSGGSGMDLEQQVMTPAECLALEPRFRLATRDLAGGIFTASEQVGDCAAFCAALSSHMRQRNNIAWSLRTPIVGPVCSGGRLVAVETDKGRVKADCFVLCLGSQSRTFARACGFYLPIYPLKGYSITLTVEPGARALRHSITDFERKLVFAPLAVDGQPVVRVAGIADFDSDDTTVDPSRVNILQKAAAEVLGMTATDDVRPWCGPQPPMQTDHRVVTTPRVIHQFRSRDARMDARLWQCAADGGLDQSQTGGHRGQRFCRASFGMIKFFKAWPGRKLLNFIVCSAHVKRNDTICKIDCVDRALLAQRVRGRAGGRHLHLLGSCCRRQLERSRVLT